MKRYEHYLPVSNLLTNEIPSHWEMKRNRVFLRPKFVSVGQDPNKYPLLSLTTNGIIYRDVESGKGKFPKDFDTYQVVEPNDIVFCLFDVDETPRTVGLSALNGMLTGAYDAFSIADSANPRFINYYYTAVDDIKALRPYYTGLRKVVKKDKFMAISIPLPPINEQEKIVAYLDRQINLIESCKAQKENELKALNELRRAIIAEAVTHGLDSSAPLKDSGIPWIGQIPAHWTLMRIKNLLEESKVKSIDGHEQSLSLSKTAGVIPYEEKENRTMQSESLVGAKVVKCGDVVFNRFKARLFAISNYDGVVSPDYAVYNGKGRANLNYLVFLFGTEMYRAAFDRKASGIGDGFSRLYTADLFSMYAIFPPIEEQKEIVKYIALKTNQIDSMIQALKAEIDHLTEYKQRLISDVITGQLNVQDEIA